MKFSLSIIIFVSFLLQVKCINIVKINWETGEITTEPPQEEPEREAIVGKREFLVEKAGSASEDNSTAAAEEEKDYEDDCEEFSCGDGACIKAELICDGISQCGNGHDEQNCDGLIPKAGEVTTEAPPAVVTKDEFDGYGGCWGDMFACGDRNGTCVLSENVCDGNADCDNGKDEEFCAPKDGSKCEDADLSSCQDRWGSCVNKSQVCDGTPNCMNNHDERFCDADETGCPAASFLCTGEEKVCVGKSLICDGRADCPNSEDEQGCLDESKQGFDNSIASSYGYGGGSYGSSDYGSGSYGGGSGDYGGVCNETGLFYCVEDDCASNILESQVCDRVQNCENGRDELGCTYPVTTTTTTEEATTDPVEATTAEYYYETCLDDQFTCSDSYCLPGSARCDGFRDCSDGGDEASCDDEQKCTDEQFKCKDGACIDLTKRCDGAIDCVGADDEQDCDDQNSDRPTSTQPPRNFTSSPATSSGEVKSEAVTASTAEATTTPTYASSALPEKTTKETEQMTSTTEDDTTTVEILTTTTKPARPSLCFYRGRVLTLGQVYRVNNCTQATCEEGGRVDIEIISNVTCLASSITASITMVLFMLLSTLFFAPR